MIKETDGDSFENRRSLVQKLTFKAADAEFFQRNVAFGTHQKKMLRLISPEGVWTNLALLLSEQ